MDIPVPSKKYKQTK